MGFQTKQLKLDFDWRSMGIGSDTRIPLTLTVTHVLIFPYNVPKTTVTLLWEVGTDSREGTPLFPGFD